MREGYELVATRFAQIELMVERYYVHDDGTITDYQGPQLVVLVSANRIVTFHDLGRQIDELSAERSYQLVESALAACDEPQADFGIDTAMGRPTTTFRLRAYRALHETTRASRHAINGYAPRALGPVYSAFLALLRERTGPLPAAASRAWDLAATWFAPSDLGPLYRAGQPVPMPAIVTAFAEDDTVYFRAGQPPNRSELYRLDGLQLVWLRGNETIPLTAIDGPNYALPCGAGAIHVHQEWQQPRRIYVRIEDPVRGIYVQRD